jgi:hypothetical protein
MAGGRPSKFKPKGRPSSFNEKVASEICERIATTPRGIDFICESDDEMPSARTVHRWLNEDESFRQSYLRARERQADLIFDECLEIADDASRDTKMVGREGEEYEVCNTEFVQRAKLRIDTRMRMAGKLAPKKYGDKLDIEHSGGVTVRADDLDERL